MAKSLDDCVFSARTVKDVVPAAAAAVVLVVVVSETGSDDAPSIDVGTTEVVDTSVRDDGVPDSTHAEHLSRKSQVEADLRGPPKF